MVERLSALMEAMFQKEQHQYQSKDKIFWMNTKGSYGFASVTLNRHYFIQTTQIAKSTYIFCLIRNQ
jgi:hypothetical protein